jgi:hypothetical protein
MMPRYFGFARCQRCFSAPGILDGTTADCGGGANFWNSRAGRVFWGLRVVLFGLEYGSMCEIDAPVSALEPRHLCFNRGQALVAGSW